MTLKQKSYVSIRVYIPPNDFRYNHYIKKKYK